MKTFEAVLKDTGRLEVVCVSARVSGIHVLPRKEENRGDIGKTKIDVRFEQSNR